MKKLNGVVKGAFPIEEVGEETCECGNVYKLYKTPRGVLGGCKPCAEKQVIKDFNLPTAEEYRKEKELQFIANFERVTNDLKIAGIKTYNPSHDTQLKAKQEAIKFIKSFKENKNQSLVFSGTPGLGKSHLAYAIARTIREQGYKALFIKSTHLLEHVRNIYNNTSNVTEEQLFKMLAELDLLVLDDVGSEYVKINEIGHESWASDILFRVYDSRLNKATITTTNYGEVELEAKYGNNGPRIIDRMVDNAIGIRLEGKSHRRQKHAF